MMMVRTSANQRSRTRDNQQVDGKDDNQHNVLDYQFMSHIIAHEEMLFFFCTPNAADCCRPEKKCVPREL